MIERLMLQCDDHCICDLGEYSTNGKLTDPEWLTTEIHKKLSSLKKTCHYCDVLRYEVNGTDCQYKVYTDNDELYIRVLVQEPDAMYEERVESENRKAKAKAEKEKAQLRKLLEKYPDVVKESK